MPEAARRRELHENHWYRIEWVRSRCRRELPADDSGLLDGVHVDIDRNDTVLIERVAKTVDAACGEVTFAPLPSGAALRSNVDAKAPAAPSARTEMRANPRAHTA